MTCEQGLPGAAGVACLGRTGPQDQDHEACVGDRVKRAYGFDFANSALGFIMPTLGPSSMSCRTGEHLPIELRLSARHRDLDLPQGAPLHVEQLLETADLLVAEHRVRARGPSTGA